MKYLIASDIHGSEFYCEKLIEKFEKNHCDYLILCGDILYHGPRNELPKGYNPKGVVELLNKYSNKIIACRGNCDSEVDQMVLNFNITSDIRIINEKDYTINISHGHIYNPDNLPNFLNNNDIFIYGHIHVPKCYSQDGIQILNPGSTSIPKNETANSYAILENRTFTLKNIIDDSIIESKSF